MIYYLTLLLVVAIVCILPPKFMLSFYTNCVVFREGTKLNLQEIIGSRALLMWMEYFIHGLVN